MIMTPLAQAVLFEAQIYVAGTIDDATAEVWVNGQAATVGDGFWEVPAIPLAMGMNVLTATATDLAGNVSQVSQPVIRAVGGLQAISVSPTTVRLAAVGVQQQLVLTGVLSGGETRI